jgi:hypothetical protein
MKRHNLNCLTDIIRMNKSTRMRWAGHTARNVVLEKDGEDKLDRPRK